MSLITHVSSTKTRQDIWNSSRHQLGRYYSLPGNWQNFACWTSSAESGSGCPCFGVQMPFLKHIFLWNDYVHRLYTEYNIILGQTYFIMAMSGAWRPELRRMSEGQRVRSAVMTELARVLSLYSLCLTPLSILIFLLVIILSWSNNNTKDKK